MRRRPTVTLSALVVVLVAACGAPDDRPAGPASATPPPVSSETPSQTEPAPTDAGPTDAAPGATDEAPAEEIVLTIADFAFDVPVTVPPGAEVTVVNEDTSFHTVTAADGSFDVDAPGGQTVTFTAPEEPGEYAFSCTPHPQMTAMLTVG